ncbi:MAG: acetyl-CoA carboxylase biotin carboxyl carrier protein subunit [Candidatus Zixiibacteriota bacterium]|nr:MAG: acetyl-CoA carboxylase biotin carboxyl carrier protein subunit [candidate division Zixibacteria bacterium]
MESNSFNIKLNNKAIKIDNYQIRAGRHEISSTERTWQFVTFLKDNQPYEIELLKDDTAYYCWLGSRLAQCEVVDEKTARYAKIMGDSIGSGKARVLSAPMPGMVVGIEVNVGQNVKKGDGLLIVEAMKMENELKATHSGTIKEIKVKAGQSIEKNQPLVVFE